MKTNVTIFNPHQSTEVFCLVYVENDATTEADNRIQDEQAIAPKTWLTHIVEDGEDLPVELHNLRNGVLVTCNEGAIQLDIFEAGSGAVERGSETPLATIVLYADDSQLVKGVLGERLVITPASFDEGLNQDADAERLGVTDPRAVPIGAGG